MFVMNALHSMCGDGTTPYELSFYGEYTVEKFLQEVLEKRSNEHGSINFHAPGTMFGIPGCYYRDGKITKPMEEEYLKKKIVKAKAVGGWFLMDYLLWVE